ncbi:TauD/TfdA family dioxygenase [Candidatus Entotheonella serta]|nr:TauD/TfdA family dioxygenase [Candidatus Entotheonella serta]
MHQPFNVIHADSVIGVEIHDLDLAQPLANDCFTAIEAIFNERSVLCLRNQRLTEPQFIDFARRFGAIEQIFLTHYAHPQYLEILLVSNIKENGQDIGHADAGRVWHSDMSYTQRPPRATMLYALEVPMEDGVALGSTQFASAAAAYDSLPEAMKTRLDGLRAVHQVAGRRKRTGTGQQDNHLREQQPSVIHPVVRTHPFTGRKCLYVNKGECQAIEGVETDEALALVDDLADRIVAPPFRYVHQWRVGDLLMWDNCSVQHLATFDYEWPKHRRLMHRITVGGTTPV